MKKKKIQFQRAIIQENIRICECKYRNLAPTDKLEISISVSGKRLKASTSPLSSKSLFESVLYFDEVRAKEFMMRVTAITISENAKIAIF
jgi:hypothetical protein